MTKNKIIALLQGCLIAFPIGFLIVISGNVSVVEALKITSFGITFVFIATVISFSAPYEQNGWNGSWHGYKEGSIK